MSAKLDLFKEILPALDCGNTKFYSKLDDTQKKEISPYVLMRWLSSSKNYPEHYLIMVNDIVNNNFTNLYKFPELQWMLLSICGIGRKDFHQWVKPGRKRGQNKVQEEIAKLYPHYSKTELVLIEKIHSKDEIKQLFVDHGMSDSEIEEII